MSVNSSYFSGVAQGGGPSTTATYEEPWAQAMRRGFLESAFGMAKQPIPVPVRQVAGLDPYEMRARELAGGLGGFTPYIQQGGQMMQQGAGYYTPGGISQFYNPYEQDVVQQSIRDMQEANAQQSMANRDRAVSSGAFGGSRGRLMEQERERAFGRGMMEGIGGLRSTGFGQATTAAQNAARGLGGLGQQFGNLGMTGQEGLMNQMNAFNQMGQTGRGIQDQMYGAQFNAASNMAQEPWKRMQGLQGMLGMLPQTGARTTWNPIPNTFDYGRGIADLFGFNIPGQQKPASGQSNQLQQVAQILQLLGGAG